MSVLIKGMEMPKACEWCSFISTFTTESGLGCRCEVEKFEFWDYSKRQENCPLVEIPTPHGRLIDADKAAHSILMMSSHPCGCSIENVKDVVEWLKFINGDGNNFAFPTIIEAEVSEE